MIDHGLDEAIARLPERYQPIYGRDADVLVRLLDGQEVGALFEPSPKKRSSRSRWISAVRPAGTITVDGGAARALVERNRSLLPAGIVGVEGAFSPGDAVSIVHEGREVARGLSNYAAEDVEKIRGRKTTDVRQMLGEAAYDEVVHRDNLVLC